MAPQPPPGGDRPGAPRGGAGDPRLLLRARTSSASTRRSSRRPSASEAGNLFATEYFDEGNAYLAQTGQLYGEAAAAAFGKVYCFGPTFRAEKSKTRRHLTEFWMIEPEVALNDSDDNMRLQEEFVALHRAARASSGGSEELKELERDIAKLERVTAPFPRSHYTDAVAMLNSKGSDIEVGRRSRRRGRGAAGRGTTTGRCSSINYPKEAKAFYMKENPEDPRTVLCDDCLAPEGYGEIIGGSQREDDYDKLLARIKEAGPRSEAYGWYLDLRKYGTFVHSGFGLGLERTVAWICGMPHIREAIAFPRQIHRLYP